jgi:hypothetical protein
MTKIVEVMVDSMTDEELTRYLKAIARKKGLSFIVGAMLEFAHVRADHDVHSAYGPYLIPLQKLKERMEEDAI